VVGDRFDGCKAILFDYGGTLDSDGVRWPDRFYALYDEANIGLPREEIKRAFYYAEDCCYTDRNVAVLDLRGLIEQHVHLQFETLGVSDRPKEQEFVDKFCGMSEKSMARAARLLGRAKSRYRLGIVSNFYGNLANVLKEAGLSNLLDVVVDSNLEGVQKPDPNIFLLALTRLGLPAQDVAFVGDSYERDIVPSGRLGMRTIWLKESSTSIVATGEDACISSLSELEGLIL
jgi:putative hydrolase of the HAD superfamily